MTDSEEPLRQYVWGEYLDELWTVDRGFVPTVAYFNDGSGAERLFALGTVMHHVAGLTDEEARLIEAFEYTPYGRPTRILPNPESDEVAFHPSDIRTPGAPSVHDNPFLYTGQRLDPETGWFYYKNRYYSPPTGRFVSRDPIGTLGGLNLYCYVISMPTMASDPHGLYPKNWAETLEDIKNFEEELTKIEDWIEENWTVWRKWKEACDKCFAGFADAYYGNSSGPEDTLENYLRLHHSAAKRCSEARLDEKWIAFCQCAGKNHLEGGRTHSSFEACLRSHPSCNERDLYARSVEDLKAQIFTGNLDIARACRTCVALTGKIRSKFKSGKKK